MKLKPYLAGLIITTSLCGCNNQSNAECQAEEARQEQLADSYQDAANDCYNDVEKIPIMDAYSCTEKLKDTATSYYSNLSKVEVSMKCQKEGTVPLHAYIGATARSTAWMAAAHSNAKFRNELPILTLW